MRRALALALVAALGAPQALPLLPAAPAEAEVEAHHHPPGCPWQGTPRCPHAHHGPSSDPAWAPCAETPQAVAAEGRMAWAPPTGLVAPSSVPAPALRGSAFDDARPLSDPPTDVEIPPPRPVAD